MLFPTDLASFLELIRQNGDAAYSLMFAYAASHSLLLALFAGYAAHAGALSFGTGHRGLLARQLRRRRRPFLDRTAFRHTLARIVSTDHTRRPDRGPAGGPSLRLDDPVASLPARHSRRRRLCLRDIAAAVVDLSGAQLRRGRPVVVRDVSVGYAFGQVAEKVMSDASSGLGLVMLVAFLGLSWILSKKLERAVERA